MIRLTVLSSGSTGKPKGVLISHEALSTSVRAHGSFFGLNSRSRVLQYTSYTFDPCITEIFGALLYKGCICIPTEHGRINDLAKCINELRVNWAFLTPSVVKLIQPLDVPNLQTLVLGGEAVSQDEVKVWADKVSLINGYGPTEATIFCLGTPILPESSAKTIGRAIASRSWVVNHRDHDRLVPIGAVGELLVEGKILSNGYLGDEERTAAMFIEDPKWTSAGSQAASRRFYKTGDLVHYNVDGSLTYIGRKDMQVKIRGQRVELGEIESHIKRYLDVSQVVVDVISRLGATSHQSLVAFICATDQTRHHIEQLETYLGDQLPSYMVPSAFHFVSQIPRSSSGKTDRDQLRQLARHSFEREQTRLTLDDTCIDLVDMNDKVMQQIWAELFGLHAAAITGKSNFFHLGGDSLAAIKLVGRARNAGLAISVQEIFLHPTLSGLSKFARSISSQKLTTVPPFSLLASSSEFEGDVIVQNAAAQCQRETSEIEDVYPTTPLQEGLFTLSMHRRSYFNQYAFQLDASVEIERFKSAWAATIRAIPILRSRIIISQQYSTLQAVVDEEIEWESAGDVATLLSAPKEQPNYGSRLTRFAIVDDLLRGKHFFWHIHHALFDGWCFPLILKTVEAFYGGTSIPSTVHFKHFVRHLGETDVESSKHFWRSKVDDAQTLSFPKLPSASFEPDPSSLLSVTAQIPSRPETHITTASIIRAAWAIVVAQHTGSDDVVFGAATTGRNAQLPGIDAVIGPTLATVPVRQVVDPSVSTAHFLQSVQDYATDCIPHEHFGLQNIKKLSSGARNACQFQTFMVIQTPGPLDASAAEASLLGRCKVVETIDTYGIQIECYLHADRVLFEVKFDQRLLPQHLMESLLDRWSHVFQQLSEPATDRLICQLDIVGHKEMLQIQAWNGNIPTLSPTIVHNVISEWAQRQPNASAVTSWDANLTYLELEDYSNRLAHYLSGRVVLPETLIPLCFDKSCLTVVVQLAVLKAGYAFIPLDATHPSSRLKEIVEESQSKFVLTSESHAQLWPAKAILLDWTMLKNLPMHERFNRETKGCYE
jgi:non-ribosomal peptide synthetase component F/aryl carrier-like protein